MGGRATGGGDRDDGGVVGAAPWVLIVAARDEARAWLRDRVQPHAPVRAVAGAGDVSGGIGDGVRPSLVVVDLDQADRDPVELLWSLARIAPSAPRLLIARPGTPAHADAYAFAEAGDLLLDQPCTGAQVEVAITHMLGAMLLHVPAPRGAVEIPAHVAARVDEAWRSGRACSCWWIDLSHLRRAMAATWNDRAIELVSITLARCLSEVFPGLVEVLRMVPIEPAAVALIVAHAPPRDPLDACAGRIEGELARALGPALADRGDGKTRLVVAAADVAPAPRASVAPRLAASIAAVQTDAADRVRGALAADRRRLLDVLDGGLQLAFSPIVDLDVAAPYAYQAHVAPTWPEDLGSVFDVSFLAAQVGLGARFDEEVVRGALRASIEMGPAGARLFVRVSPDWLLEPSGLDRAGDWLRAAGLVPAQVVFELDDLTELRGAAAARALVAPLIEAGFGLAITCRGSRYLTLDDLMSVRPDIVRLPGRWVRGLQASRVRRELIAALVRVARALDVAVVATGADRADDLAALCDLGVRYAGGALFGRPWVTFAAPRPRGLKKLEAIWRGELVAAAPREVTLRRQRRGRDRAAPGPRPPGRRRLAAGGPAARPRRRRRRAPARAAARRAGRRGRRRVPGHLSRGSGGGWSSLAAPRPAGCADRRAARARPGSPRSRPAPP